MRMAGQIFLPLLLHALYTFTAPFQIFTALCTFILIVH